MGKKQKYFTSVSIGTAAVWFATHCGAGFASGTQELQYFASHGWFGPLMPFLTIAIIAITYYVGIETARETDLWHYNGWAKHAFDPLGKFLTITMDFCIIITTIAASAASIAAGSILLQQQYGIPELIGSLIMFASITILVIFGENLVRKSSLFITIAILIIISFILILGLVKFWPNIVEHFSNKYVNPQAPAWTITGQATATTEGNFVNALLWALTYSGFQIGAVGGIAAAFKGAMSAKEAKGAMTLGYIINVLMLFGICLLIFSGMPEIFTNPDAKKLPTIYIVNQLDSSVLHTLYPILLFLALLSTAVGFIFGMVTRLNPYLLNNMQNKVLKKAILSMGCLIICYLVSRLGLMWVVQVAYKYLGIFSWIFLIIPLWTLGFRNIKRRRAAEKLAQTEN